MSLKSPLSVLLQVLFLSLTYGSSVGAWTIASTAHADSQLSDVDFAQVLQPFSFVPNAPSPLEGRLNYLSFQIDLWCQLQGKVLLRPAVCLWPKAVAEFDAMAAVLKLDSYDGSKLALTLGARLHPLNFARFYKSGEGFDSNYARFLIAQRLLRELWPSVRQFIASQHLAATPFDDWILPWSNAKTPWSFLLNVVQAGFCSGDRSVNNNNNDSESEDDSSVYNSDDDPDAFSSSVPECYPDEDILLLLRTVSEVIGNDPKYVASLKSFRESSKPPFSDDKTSLLYNDLLKMISGGQTDRMLMLPTSPNLSQLDVASASEYFEQVAGDAALPVSFLPVFTGDACGDISLSLEAAKTDVTSKSWASNLPLGFSCDIQKGKVPYMDGAALDDLKNRGKIWRFNFFQLRLLILSLFSSMRDITPEQIEIFQLHEILSDVEGVRQQLPGFADREKRADPVQYRLQLRYLYHYLLDAHNRLAEIQRKDQN